MRVLLLTVIIALTVAFVSCSSKSEENKKQITDVINSYAEAINKEALDDLLNTFDPSSPAAADAKKMMEQLFKNYDLNVEIESVKVLKGTDEKAEAEIVQVNKKKSGPDFRDNKVKQIVHLTKVEGKWKIHSFTVIRTEYLDQK